MSLKSERECIVVNRIKLRVHYLEVVRIMGDLSKAELIQNVVKEIMTWVSNDLWNYKIFVY